MPNTKRSLTGVSSPLRIAYLLLTSGRPMSGREIAEELGVKNISYINSIVNDMELAGFVTEITTKPSQNSHGFKYMYSAKLRYED